MSSAVPIPQACELIGISRSKFYELLNSEEIKSVKIGRRRLVRVADLNRWLANLPTSKPSQVVP